MEEDANEAKVRVLISIQAKVLSERELQLQSPQIKSAITALQIHELGDEEVR